MGKRIAWFSGNLKSLSVMSKKKGEGQEAWEGVRSQPMVRVGYQQILFFFNF